MNRDHSAPAVVEPAGRHTHGLPDQPPIGCLPVSETQTVLHSLGRMIEQRDRHTAGHCERLAYSGVALGVAMALDSESLVSLYVGGYLHDIGKVGIPDSILFKPGRLNTEEWHIMRLHPVRGEEICRPLASLEKVLPLIRNHHERWDGTGYPDGMRARQIPLLARVLQVVDIYDALTNPRPYKHDLSGERALEILKEESDRGWRDREIVELFTRLKYEELANTRPAGCAVIQSPALVESLQNLQAHLSH
ncbi:MAG: HD-GYP domain-containing protein [Candidatus Solibacter sp.]